MLPALLLFPYFISLVPGAHVKAWMRRACSATTTLRMQKCSTKHNEHVQYMHCTRRARCVWGLLQHWHVEDLEASVI